MTRQTLSPAVIALVITGVLTCGVFIYWQLSKGSETPEAPIAEAPRPEPSAQAPAPRPADLPPLEQSDGLVRSLVEQLSEHPRLARWLVSDDLANRFVASIDNVARRESPRNHLAFLGPERGFVVDSRDGRFFIANESYARYDELTAAFLSIDTAASVEVFQQLEPLFDEAYRQLGYPDGEFTDALARALDHIVATPIPEPPIEVEPKVTGYRYKDPALEALSPAQQHFLRLGPENARQARSKLRLISTALGLSEAQRKAENGA